MDYQRYGGFFAFRLEKEAEFARFLREHAEINREKKAEAEPLRVTQELVQQEKAKPAQELMEAPAATLKKHGRTQQGQHVADHVIR